MNTKIIALLIVCVLASMSEIATAERPSFCSLPQVVGRCRMAKPRFAFNAKSSKCEQFVYGGCEGNANNFYTEEACYAACG